MSKLPQARSIACRCGHLPVRDAALLALVVLLAPVAPRAQCVLVRERGGAAYTPHVVIHFGDPAGVPGDLQPASSIDRTQPSLCVPIYAYDLWEGANLVEFALHTPLAPAGFEPGPGIAGLQMELAPDSSGVTTSLRLTPPSTQCGPMLLGCLRLPTAALPSSFLVEVVANQTSGRLALRTPAGEWRTASVDEGGGHIGGNTSHAHNVCVTNRAVRDLAATVIDRTGIVDLSWTSGSGGFTLVRYRLDGRYPTDPWDGELMAFLPSSIRRYSHLFGVPGDLHIAAWSVTRGAHGYLYAASHIECGSLATVSVHMPIAVLEQPWHGIKSLYR